MHAGYIQCLQKKRACSFLCITSTNLDVVDVCIGNYYYFDVNMHPDNPFY